MAREIELVADSDGVVVAGEQTAVERFLEHAGLTPYVRDVGLSKLSTVLRTSSDLAETGARIAEQSAMYLKLTPESAQRLKDAGGLMKTKTKGVSHAMLGEPGNIGKWLQVEDGPASLLTNPAALSGVGGLMSQLSQQTEAQELKALLVRIDAKLDQVRRAQRDAVLAKMDGAAESIEEAMTIHSAGGDTETLWDKVSGSSSDLLEVQNAALRELGALAELIEGKSKTGELKRAAQEIEREVAVQLSILARTFELQDQFRIVELDHVFATAPDKLEGHTVGVEEARQKRRARVLAKTERLMDRMDEAGGIANANILLHARAARAVIGSLNVTANLIDEFHAPLGIESDRNELSAASWRTALANGHQLKTAAVEVGQTTAKVGGAAAVIAVSVVGVKNLPNSGGS